jgi:hypothetical protein
MMSRENELADAALKWVQTNVLRLVALRVVPLIVGTGTFNAVLIWAQAEIGLGLDPAEVAAWIGTTMAGVVATAFAYVRNHGQGAALLGRALLELEKLRQAGNVVPIGGAAQLAVSAGGKPPMRDPVDSERELPPSGAPDR